MKIVINGYGGAGTIEYGGRDYHQNPRPDTDNKDFIVGQVDRRGARVRRAARQAADDLRASATAPCRPTRTRQRTTATAPDDEVPLGVGRLADGRELRPRLQPAWAVPRLRNGAASQQLGAFRANGSVDTASSPFANSVTQLAELVVLNYLALHGEEAQFGMVLSNPRLGDGRGRGTLHRVQPNRLTSRQAARHGGAAHDGTRRPSRADAASTRHPLAASAPLLALARLVVPAAAGTTSGSRVRTEPLICRQCKAAFPLYRNGAARIPWLFRDPEARARVARAFQRLLARERSRAERACRRHWPKRAAAARPRASRGSSQAQRVAATADLRAARHR